MSWFSDLGDWVGDQWDGMWTGLDNFAKWADKTDWFPSSGGFSTGINLYNYNEPQKFYDDGYTTGSLSYEQLHLGAEYKITGKSGVIHSDPVVGSLKKPSYNYGSTYGDLTVGMSSTEFNSASLELSMWGVTVEGKSNIVASGGNSSTIESWNNSTSYTQKNIFIEYKTGYLDNFGEASWSLYHTSTVGRGRKNITTTNTGDYIVTYSPAINSSFSFSPTNNRFSVNINGYITIAVSNEGLHGSFEMGGYGLEHTYNPSNKAKAYMIAIGATLTLQPEGYGGAAISGISLLKSNAF